MTKAKRLSPSEMRKALNEYIVEHARITSELQHARDKRAAAELELGIEKEQSSKLREQYNARVHERDDARENCAREKTKTIHYRDLACDLSRVVMIACNTPQTFCVNGREEGETDRRLKDLMTHGEKS